MKIRAGRISSNDVVNNVWIWISAVGSSLNSLHLEDHSMTCKWLISMVSKFPKFPFQMGAISWLINGGYPNQLRPPWDDPPSITLKTMGWAAPKKMYLFKRIPSLSRFVKVAHSPNHIPSLKLTARLPPKINGWKMKFSSGQTSYFQGLLLMEEILHQLIGSLSVYPMIYKVLYIQGGVGFLPSTVC